MNYKTFEDHFELIELNFNFKYPAKLLALIYAQIKDMSDQEFKKGINRLLSMTIKEWSELYGFGKVPTIADWKNLLSGKKELSKEELANIECQKIMDSARYGFGNPKFDNPVTQKVFNSFPNGVKTIHWEIFDPSNDYKKGINAFKKDLVTRWLSYADQEILTLSYNNINNIKTLENDNL